MRRMGPKRQVQEAKAKSRRRGRMMMGLQGRPSRQQNVHAAVRKVQERHQEAQQREGDRQGVSQRLGASKEGRGQALGGECALCSQPALL